jgi:hypothetical protein
MHFATGARTWRVARLYSEIAVSRKPFGIGHMYIYNFLLRMTDTMTSQNIGSWLRHCATSRKVAGSIPDEVTEFFNCPNHSSRTMALGSTLPLTEMSIRNLPGGKGRPFGA